MSDFIERKEVIEKIQNCQMTVLGSGNIVGALAMCKLIDEIEKLAPKHIDESSSSKSDCQNARFLAEWAERKLSPPTVPHTTIKVKYFTDIEPPEKIDKGGWIDLRAAADVTLKKGEYALIPLGVGMILPEGYEAHIAPRRSTYKHFKIILANSVGIIDSNYCGVNDQWRFPAIALEDTVIHKNDRICQFRIVEKQPPIKFETVKKLGDVSRGGLGSTGKS